jgi:hypothetical protein
MGFYRTMIVNAESGGQWSLMQTLKNSNEKCSLNHTHYY